ncbi:MAG TPA: KH domain-containing protein [Patescibacteria group bacterium]|nr:KH domain-containing protein [Patescibacteria group bacterium]
MQELLNHILTGILGESVDIKEETSEGFTNFVVSVPKDKVGIVIGKGGKTINAIKNVLKIRAIRENIRVDIQVNEA